MAALSQRDSGLWAPDDDSYGADNVEYINIGTTPTGDPVEASQGILMMSRDGQVYPPRAWLQFMDNNPGGAGGSPITGASTELYDQPGVSNRIEFRICVFNTYFLTFSANYFSWAGGPYFTQINQNTVTQVVDFWLAFETRAVAPATGAVGSIALGTNPRVGSQLTIQESIFSSAGTRYVLTIGGGVTTVKNLTLAPVPGINETFACHFHAISAGKP